MTLEADLAEFQHMEDVLRVFEELAGDKEEELDDLITPYRKLVHEEEVILKEAPFATSVGDEAKVFVFNDVVLVGLNAQKLGKNSRQKRSGTLDKKKKKGTLEIKKGTLTRHKGHYKLYHYLLIENCKVKLVGADKEGFQGVQLTHVSRWREPSKKGGTMRVLTKIAKMELWFPTLEMAQDFEMQFQQALQALNEIESEPEPSGSSRFSLSRSASGTSGSRKWASGRVRRSTLDKQSSRPSTNTMDDNTSVGDDDSSVGKSSRNGSIVSHGDSVGESLAGGLQLADLEQRYNVDMKSDVDSDKLEIEVEFGEGPLGLSLGSAAGVGVVVGKLAPNGFAEFSGVMISDRVIAINDEEVGLDDHWQECLKKLKDYPRPVRVKFERYGARSNAVIKSKESKAAQVKEPTMKGNESAGSSRAKAKELEKILSKAQRIVAKGPAMQAVLKLLVESKAVSSSASNRAAAAVLDEIARTEVSYVNDMCSLVETYILPLRNQRVKTKCRHIEGGSMVCDHGILRSTCLRSAKEHQPIISSEQLQSIFLNIETIIFVNVELLRLLINHLNTLSAGGKTPQLGDVAVGFADSFTKVMPFMKSYSYFCHEYPNAVDRLLLLRKENKLVGEFLTKAERQAMDNPDPSKRVLSLSSLLIKPVQRLCKYPLLFHELLKQVPSNMKGRDELVKACERVEIIAESVNRQVGESKQFERFMEIYRDLGGEVGAPGLVTPSRRYVLQAECMMTMAPYGDAPPQPRTLLLFNDLIVLAKGEGGTLSRPKSLQRMSLRRTESAQNVKVTLERTWSKLVRTFTGDNLDKEVAPKSPGAKRKNSLKRMRALKLTHRFELHRFQMKELTEDPLKPEQFGLEATVKERVRVENEGGKSGGTEKWKTNINKYMLTFDDKDELNRVMSHLEECLRKLKQLGDAHKEGEAKFGTKKEKRSWATKNKTLKAKVKD